MVRKLASSLNSNDHLDLEHLQMVYDYGPGSEKGAFYNNCHYWRVCVQFFTDYWRERHLERQLLDKLATFNHRKLTPSYGILDEFSYFGKKYIHYNVDCFSEADADMVMAFCEEIDEALPPDFRIDRHRECYQLRFRRVEEREAQAIYEWCRSEQGLSDEQFDRLEKVWVSPRPTDPRTFATSSGFRTYHQGTVRFYDKGQAMQFKLTWEYQ